MIIAYGRCYAQVLGGGFTKLDAKDVFKNNDELMELHDELITLRNELVAHNGETEHSEYDFNYKAYSEHIEIYIRQKFMFPHPKRLDDYLFLFSHVHSHIRDKINISKEKLEKETGKKILIK